MIHPARKEPTTMQRFIVDTDPGADDAIALMMALRHAGVQVDAITTVAGNVPVEQATANALYIAELCGAEVPVYQGMDRPMLRQPPDARHVHGQDGLGDLDRQPPRGHPQPEHAVDALIRHALAAPGQITLVALGPLTNVALALRREPALATALRRLVLMGGAVNALGNVTPSAEFNIWADPEAANIVFHAGAPVTMAGWELTSGDMLLGVEEIDRLRSHDSPLAVFAVDCYRQVRKLYEAFHGQPVMGLPDPIVMAVAIDPGLCRTEFLYVTVETTSELTRGETVVDRRGVLGQPPNIQVCFDPDPARFKRLLFDTLT
jgi:purine nucleosidase